MQAAQWNREFVADLAAEGELLGEAHVVRLGGLAPANQARSGGNVLEVIFIAKPSHFPECEDALVDRAGRLLLCVRWSGGIGGWVARRSIARLWRRSPFSKCRNSKREGRLDEPSVAGGQGVLGRQDVAGPLRCDFF